MLPIFRKEIASFFSSPVGYLVMGVFLVLTGLFLWVFKGPFNILDYGFADLSLFFLLAPWVLLLLIPAVSMRTFSEERKMGTLELLLSRPLSVPALVLGKFLGIFVLVILTLAPTLLYVWAVWDLGSVPGNLDSGLVIGSYLGLLLLVASYTSIGLFASSLTENQIASFLLALLLTFLCYYGFESMATLFSDGGQALTVSELGMKAHYETIGQGVLDSRDIVYFLSISAFFLLLSSERLRNTEGRGRSKFLKRALPMVAGLILLNLLGGIFHTRWDLTEDRRFTLADTSINTINALEGPVIVDVLLDGNLPPEFVRLQRETRLLLEQFQDQNPGLSFVFIDPVADSENPEAVQDQLQQIGLKPASVTTRENGRVSQELLYPWAMISYGERTERVALLKNKLGANTEERVNNSIESLEYAFSDAFSKLGMQKQKKIAVLRGNGELQDAYLSDYLTALQGYYKIAPFTLDSVAVSPDRTLQQLSGYDAALIAKPTEAFSEAEKLVLDQFMVGGGKTLWLIDAVNIEMDSLLAGGGQSLAVARDLNLGDLLFRYGVRINADLVADLFCGQIVLATGEGREARYNPLPWIYHPLLLSRENHPVNTNMEALRMQFASSIDTVGSTYQKTVLYTTSPRSRTEGTPRVIGLDILEKEPRPEAFGPGNYPVAVLVEGAFRSAYANRVRPVKLPTYKQEGEENKMIVISDGDLVANQLSEGRPLELGYDKWTNTFYGNKEFLVNAMNYLLDDRGLVNLRNKKVSIPLLDSSKIENRKTRWQLLTIGIPLLLVLGIGLVFNAVRRRHYT